MAAFRPLPFQFQQRGPDLAAKLKDPDSFKQFTEQRDQDLENYLANLSGAVTGLALWSASAYSGGGGTDVFVGDGAGGTLAWSGFGLGAFNPSGTYTGPVSDIAVLYAEVLVTEPIGGDPGLFEVNFAGEKHWLAYDGTGETYTFHLTTISSPGGAPNGVTVKGAVKNMDLQTSTGPFTGPPAPTLASASAFIVAFDNPLA